MLRCSAGTARARDPGGASRRRRHDRRGRRVRRRVRRRSRDGDGGGSGGAARLRLRDHQRAPAGDAIFVPRAGGGSTALREPASFYVRLRAPERSAFTLVVRAVASGVHTQSRKGRRAMAAVYAEAIRSAFCWSKRKWASVTPSTMPAKRTNGRSVSSSRPGSRRSVLLEEDPGLEPREVAAEAEVLPPAERDVAVRPAARVELVGARLLDARAHRLVAVGRGEPDVQHAALRDGEVSELRVGEDEERLGREGRAEAEHLLDDPRAWRPRRRGRAARSPARRTPRAGRTR